LISQRKTAPVTTGNTVSLRGDANTFAEFSSISHATEYRVQMAKVQRLNLGQMGQQSLSRVSDEGGRCGHLESL
jgi:hypothetical protein